VGNASCGPDILDKYAVSPDPVTFAFSIRPVKTNEDIGAAGRSKLPVVSMPLITRDKFAVVTIRTASPDDKVFYTLDGSEPTDKSLRYTFPFPLTDVTTIKAKVINGDMESRTAELKTKKLKMQKPVITPQNVYFTDSLPVRLSSVIGNAKIYYTLDGSEPDENSMLYTGPVWVKDDCTLKTKAYRDGFYPGDVAVSKYHKMDVSSGIQYKYYTGQWFDLPDFTKLTPERTGVAESFSLDDIENNKDHYALLMFTSIHVDEPGEYTFYVGSNDGSRLWVDNQKIIENGGQHGYKLMSGKIDLTKGTHSLMLEYFQAGGGQELKVFWKGPGFEKQELKVK
jgi:hypothetical protein